MHDLWNFVILDNPLSSYIIVAATILFVIALKRVISKLIARLIFRGIRRMGTGLDQSAFLNLVVGPIGNFLVIFVSLSSIEKLHFPSALDFDIYEVKAKSIVESLGIMVLVISFIWLLLRLVDYIALVLRRKTREGRGPRDHQMIVFIRDFLKAFIWIIGLLMILAWAFRVNVTSILASLGLAGAALALAAKESIENLIASFIIFFDKPFTAGDLLRVAGVSGTVEKIGLRSTRIRTDQKTFVTVPNKQMVDSIVDNLSLRTHRKGEIRLEITLSTEADALEKLVDGIGEILKREKVEESRAFLDNISGKAFLVNADYFTSPISFDEFNEIKQQINLKILRLMETLEVTITGASTDIMLSGGESVGTGKKKGR
jgi:MscS family membrane protein